MVSIRRCGDRAVLVELPDAATRRAWDARLQTHPVPGVLEAVPAAVTVGLILDGTRPLSAVVADLEALVVARLADQGRGELVRVDVNYDGADLAEVARAWGWTPAEVIAWHTGQVWTCDFIGFMPGFGYLVGDGEPRQVARRTDPRPRIPPGSVAVAGEWTGIYPHASPGGWQLIGRTGLAVWDERRNPPALLAPGTAVQFVELSSTHRGGEHA